MSRRYRCEAARVQLRSRQLIRNAVAVLRVGLCVLAMTAIGWWSAPMLADLVEPFAGPDLPPTYRPAVRPRALEGNEINGLVYLQPKPNLRTVPEWPSSYEWVCCGPSNRIESLLPPDPDQ